MKEEICKYNHIFNPQANCLLLVNVVAGKCEMEHSSLVICTKFNNYLLKTYTYTLQDTSKQKQNIPRLAIVKYYNIQNNTIKGQSGQWNINEVGRQMIWYELPSLLRNIVAKRKLTQRNLGHEHEVLSTTSLTPCQYSFYAVDIISGK